MQALRAGLLAIMLSGLAIAAHGQTTRKLPAFELATIKPSGPESAPMSVRRLPGGRFVTSNTPLSMLISWAFDLEDGRMVGAPKNLDSLHFDVVAKAPDEEPAAGQMQLMMQSLLAERFKLTVHHATRELVAYTLVTDAGGPKVHPSDTTEPPDANPFKMSGSGSLAGSRVTADMLAKVLSNQLGRPVVDMTGFSRPFDFTLQWTPDTVAAAVDDRSRASLFTAIREQLGFRLSAKKTPVDVIVIDRVQLRPTEN